MGGFGSGREQEKFTTCDLLMTEKDFSENVIVKTIQDYNTVLDILLKIIKGEEKEFIFDAKGQALIERPPSLGDRVKAAKVWKEMTLDKVVSDKKMIAMPEGQVNLFEDFKDAVSDLEKKLDGKIIPIGGN